MKNYIHKAYVLPRVILLLICQSCDEFVTIEPPKNQLVTTTVFSSDITANSAVVGIYSKMAENQGLFTTSAIYCGLYADEFLNATPSVSEFYENQLKKDNSTILSFWSEAYQHIYNANAILEALPSSNLVSDDVKNQLVGEAKFIRAFSHFYLVNLFGSVPLILSTDYRLNVNSSRTQVTEIYNTIIADLNDAIDLLPENYPSAERIRPNKCAASALLSRVYLYLGDWVNAEKMATSVMNNTGTYYLEPDLNKVFLANSPEAIWQLKPVSQNTNSNLGHALIISVAPNIAYLDPNFLNDFETGDKRAITWINSTPNQDTTVIWYYPFKYKVRQATEVTEYNMILRLAEQYLIRAEARANQNNIDDAKEDLNMIRNRAGLPNTDAITQIDLLLEIEKERKIELFAEEGNHRWLDLKRTNRAGEILKTKPSWQQTDLLFPIPQAEMLKAPNLTPQNPGY